MIDFNISTEKFDGVVLNTEIECVLQQIDMLFNTDIYDVLGDVTYGTNYDRYLYTLGMSNVSLESKIMNDLNSLDLGSFKPEVNVSIVEGTHRDIAFINITLYTDSEEYTKTYMIN